MQLGESSGYRGVLYATAALHCLALACSCHAAGTNNLHPLVLAGPSATSLAPESSFA